MTAEKVLATAIQLMEHTYIRGGNNGYEKFYGSYGITTLKDKHVAINKDGARFSFTGKKGIDHEITIRINRLARITQAVPGHTGKRIISVL